MRKMATVRRIDALRPIVGADAIECALVGGWTCVVKKNEYQPGDLAIYCEIDSFIPSAVAPFLTRPGQTAKTFSGVEGERLRTVKLRGQLSQGLLLPLSILPEGSVQVDADVSELLGILKYEAPIPASLSGEIKGMFPFIIPKTDQERIQNLSAEWAEWQTGSLTWEVTEKLDGTSMTVYCIDGEIGVCSRNLDLKRSTENSLWKAAIQAGLEEKLLGDGRNIAVQGEMIGSGVQGNIYKLRNQEFRVFDVYNIDAGKYLTPVERKSFVATHNLAHCPEIEAAMSLSRFTIAELLLFAEGKSVTGDAAPRAEREGLVFKCHERELSFKAISNRFLLKSGD